MATEGYVKFEYFSKGVPPYYNSRSFPELLDDESIVISTPCLEMSYHQYFALFKKFLMAVGFDEKNIMQGACNLAFNEMNNEKTMREVAEEYELIMSEQLPEIIADSKKQDEEWIEKTKDSWEQRYWALYHKMQKIENVKYTDEELDAMCDHAEKQEEQRQMTYDEAIAAGWEMTADGFWIREPKDKDFKMWNGLVPGSPEAVEKGCMCPVMDNEEMPSDKKWVDAECPIHGRKKND